MTLGLLTAVGDFDCPHCRRPLRFGDPRWTGWVVCPSCGLPVLPPELPPVLRFRNRQPARSRAAGLATLPGAPESGESQPEDARLAGRFERGEAGRSSTSGLIILTGLIVSLFLLLVAYLDHQTRQSALFGFLTIIFLLLMLRRPGMSRRSRWIRDDKERLAAVTRRGAEDAPGRDPGIGQR